MYSDSKLVLLQLVTADYATMEVLLQNMAFWNYSVEQLEQA